MAQTLTLASGGTMVIPDSAINVNVVNKPTGVAISGVLALIGEANEGPAWDDPSEGKVSGNSFGLLDINKVIAKFGSGSLVDAYKGALSPSASDRISGGPNRIILVKTNSGIKAERLTNDGHSKFIAKKAGEPGNNVQEAITTIQPEQAPTTGLFSYVPSSSASSMAVRVNGGSKQTMAISANMTPAAFVSAVLQNVEEVDAKGGQDLDILDLVAADISLSVSGQVVEISLNTPNVFAATAQAGDALRIISGSVLAGGSDENLGWYLVTGFENSTLSAKITAKKITAGAPVDVSAVAVAAIDDIIVYESVELEVAQLGENREVLSDLVGQNISASVLNQNLTVSLASGQVFAQTARVGDVLWIKPSSVLSGGGSENVGYYSVVEVSNSLSSAYIKATRLSAGSPIAVSVIAIADEDEDALVFDPQAKGSGRSLAISDNAGVVSISSVFKDLAVDDAADFIGELLISGAELRKTISVIRNDIRSQESYNVGGNISLLLGYEGSGSVTIGLVAGVLRLQTSVTGGSGGNLNIDLSRISTINDLVSKINAEVGYHASIANASEGQKNPSVLDHGTFGIGSDLSQKPARIKRDLFDLKQALSASAQLVIETIAEAGLPEDNRYLFLSGGTKGGSSSLRFAQAIDALKSVRCNFVIPLVSQDAIDDIAEGLTDSSSSYMVDSVNAAVKSHVISMSTNIVKRHRVGLVSKRDTFEVAKSSALNMATYRIAHLFQDVLGLDSNNELSWFHPWLGAVKAAAMQAAGNYRAIYNKTVNLSGVRQAAGDFNDENHSDVEDAILAGLIPIQAQETGGFTFVTDQTTYGIDNNFVYNSLQAVYVADLMALSLAQSIKTTFVGESNADVTPDTVANFVSGKMAEFKALKWIAGTAEFSAGYKSIDVRIESSVLSLQVTVIEATSLKFAVIDLNIDGVKSSATAE